MKKALLVALVLSFTGHAYAQEETKAAEGETKIKIEDAAGKKNKVEGDLDQEITNPKLRAETGSKSRWSASFTATYNGGSLEKPMSKDRPNVTRDPITPKTSMAGDFGGRYRIDKNQSVSLTTGYSLERPLHEAKRGQISNPSISYNHATKLGPIQNVASAGLTLTTNSDYREIGDDGSLGLSDTMIYDFGGSRSSVGLAVEGGLTKYSKENELVQPKGARRPAPAIAYQEDYSLAAYPFYEYQFTDKINFRTVFRPWIFSHERAEDGWTFTKRPWTQSMGVGFAVTRDIYLYPNFQWNWERWRRDDYNFAGKATRATSTVGVNATVNLF